MLQMFEKIENISDQLYSLAKAHENNPGPRKIFLTFFSRPGPVFSSRNLTYLRVYLHTREYVRDKHTRKYVAHTREYVEHTREYVDILASMLI